MTTHDDNDDDDDDEDDDDGAHMGDDHNFPQKEGIDDDNDDAQWSGTTKNHVVSTGPLTCPFARSLAPLTHLLAPPCLLCSRAPLRSFVCSLAHFAHSLARGTVNDWMAILSVFFSIFDHSAASI